MKKKLLQLNKEGEGEGVAREAREGDITERKM
jgi:hypothetical protein